MDRAERSPLAIYLDHLGRGELAYQFDAVAGRAVFYPRLVAPETGADLEWRISAGQGTVYATTVVHPQQGATYNVALIDMDEGFRLMSRVEDVAPETVKIGMRVRFRVHLPEGEDPIPVFTPEGLGMNGLRRGAAAIVGAAESDLGTEQHRCVRGNGVTAVSAICCTHGSIRSSTCTIRSRSSPPPSTGGSSKISSARATANTPGRPPLPTRLMAGLAIIKHMHSLSDEALCERWLENPYYQLLCGEAISCHRLPFDRSSLTRWRQRMGEEKLKARLQESLHAATRMGAAKPADFTRVIVDTTVQPKAIAFPTDAKLLHRARELLVRLAHRHGVRLRQSYTRLGKIALIRHQRYAHAKQFKRANRMLRTLRTQLGRVIRDIMRKIAGQCDHRRNASAVRRSTACTRRKWRVSARARRIGHTNLASRSRWRLR